MFTDFFGIWKCYIIAFAFNKAIKTDEVYKEIERFWNDVLFHRKNGCETLIKEKKSYKKKDVIMNFLD